MPAHPRNASNRGFGVVALSPRGDSPLLDNLTAAAVATVAYFVAGKLGLKLAFLHASATAVWPPTGIALAAFLLFGYRLWPGIFLGAFLVNITTAGSFWTALGIATGNTLEGLTAAWLVRRYANGWRAFERTQDTVRYWTLASVLSTTVSASLGVTSLCLTGFAGWGGFGPIWLTWWLGDAVGGFVVSSLIIVWYRGPRPAWKRARTIEAGALMLALALAAVIVFRGWFPHPYVCVPMVLWAAFRFGQRATATATFLLTAVAIWGTLRGWGPFAAPDKNTSLLLLQAFAGVIAVTSMAVAALVAERRRAVDALRSAHRELELRVQDRTWAYSVANDALRSEIAERRRAEEQLAEVARRRAEDLRDFAISVQRAQEEERGRIARELHDDLGQRLTGLKMSLQVLEDDIARGYKSPARLRQLQRELDKMINEMRRLSYNLRPAALDDFGLVVALEMLCKDFQKVHKVPTKFDAGVSLSGFHESQIDIALYRVAQEALANVAKHAQATRVSVRLSGRHDAITLAIEDDGCGFDIEAFSSRRNKGGGLGLIGMRERSELLGGTFAVESNRGQGTRVEALLPLHAHRLHESHQNTHRG